MITCGWIWMCWYIDADNVIRVCDWVWVCSQIN